MWLIVWDGRKARWSKHKEVLASSLTRVTFPTHSDALDEAHILNMDDPAPDADRCYVPARLVMSDDPTQARITGLLEAMTTGDPNADAADAVTVMDVWRKEATDLLSLLKS